MTPSILLEEFDYVRDNGNNYFTNIIGEYEIRIETIFDGFFIAIYKNQELIHPKIKIALTAYHCIYEVWDDIEFFYGHFVKEIVMHKARTLH